MPRTKSPKSDKITCNLRMIDGSSHSISDLSLNESVLKLKERIRQVETLEKAVNGKRMRLIFQVCVVCVCGITRVHAHHPMRLVF